MSKASSYFENNFNDEYFEQECDAEIFSGTGTIINANAVACSAQGTAVQITTSIEYLQVMGICLITGLRLIFANYTKRDISTYANYLATIENNMNSANKSNKLVDVLKRQIGVCQAVLWVVNPRLILSFA